MRLCLVAVPVINGLGSDTRLRILYVPNERGKALQFGLRRSFADLQEAGLIEAHVTFSLLAKVLETSRPRTQEGHRQQLLDLVRTFNPNLVLMQHLGGTGMSQEHFRAMRGTTRFDMVYHEADPYTRWKHPLPSEARLAGRSADFVYTVGAGAFRKNFLRSGARNVRWLPSIYSPGLFGQQAIPKGRRPYDVVMVANRNTPRFRGLPNWRERIRFVDYLEKRFGGRFAIYGRGWSGPSAAGSIPYTKQAEAIHSGWISANWDHFRREPCYFSDRLPISLAVGSIHVTSDHPGHSDFFVGTAPFLVRSGSFEAAGDAIDRVLERTDVDDRIELAHLSRRYAAEHLRQDDQLVVMLNSSAKHIDPEAARRAWTVG